jgi:hypothetical protein
MYYLVAYVVHPSRSELRVLQKVFGADFRGSALPVVSPPFPSRVDADARLREVSRPDISGPDEAILVQPEEQDIPPFSLESALRLLKHDGAWGQFVRDFDTTDAEIEVLTVEHSRCWIVLASVAGAQIPPGEAFVVDKYSRRVFPRRYVDALSSMNELSMRIPLRSS